MKLIYSILAAMLLFLAGCKQDFQVTVPNYVNTPVVYGLLSQNDYGSSHNDHYIRIQKGYLLKGNAYMAAGIEDSIYYPNTLSVKLYSSNGYTSYTLNRIDGATVGLNKDTGIFANVHNYLYTFNHFLDSSQTYTLVVTQNGGADTLAMASTALVNGLSILYPNLHGDSTVSFSNIPGQEEVVSWQVGNNSGVYDLTVRFFYREYVAASNTLVKDTFVDIPVFTSLIPVLNGNIATYTVPAVMITNYLSNHLTADPTLYREFGSLQFTVAAGGTGLAAYFTSQQAQSGLTSSNALPPFTNITGGYGLLSSREYQAIGQLRLTNAGLDSLACGPATSNLRFLNRDGHVCN